MWQVAVNCILKVLSNEHQYKSTEKIIVLKSLYIEGPLGLTNTCDEYKVQQGTWAFGLLKNNCF